MVQYLLVVWIVFNFSFHNCNAMADTIAIWRKYTEKKWPASSNSSSECTSLSIHTMQRIANQENGLEGQISIIVVNVSGSCWWIVSHRKLKATKLTPDQVAILCTCIVRGGKKLSAQWIELNDVCMCWAGPCLSPLYTPLPYRKCKK